MRILEYIGLDTSRVAGNYRKVAQAIAAGDFRAAQVKKLAHHGRGSFYRARLDDSNRLLFSLVRRGDECCVLMLEVIANHAYDKSRFLRGATIDEAKIPEAECIDAQREAQPLRYLHPEHAAVHLLDKPISFDDAQEAIYRQPPPLIIVGGAGSGKTALTLEKLKHTTGEVLYVTLSAYLAESARELYYGGGFESETQEVAFLSYRAFVESIHVPQGREAQWRDFIGWFARVHQISCGIDPHQALEEIRGVITSGGHGVLTRAAYEALGVRQSIFPLNQRGAVYGLFEKYRSWIAEAGLFDLNLIAQEWLARAQPRYDFVVVDEVQDITPVQLSLVLKTLKKPGQFLLCGDSNQIVHPNFFSWSQVKTLFWQDPTLAERQTLRVLAANFRNSQRATEVANTLLKIKHSRFGSIDRESNYLVQSVGASAGTVVLLPHKESAIRALDQQARQSTRFAVLVMRDEDKAEARRHFSTPLLFSIHEAKGLEYENIVLYRFVSDHRAEFGDIADGVLKDDLARGTLAYRRARDKSDKSLEVYKFFVNALYVALTRAVDNLYLVESDTAHPLFDLLGLAEGEQQVPLAAKQSTLEDWQKEARRLDLQGKQEQAEAIRRSILKQLPVPWPVFDQARTEDLLTKVFREQAVGGKLKQQLHDIATCHDEPILAAWLVQEAKFDAARGFQAQRASQGRKSYAAYFAHNFKDILRQCERHGLEHRLPMNQTPLMAAAAAGNVALVEALIERGADRSSCDHYGCNALHWALREAFRDARFAQGPFARLYECLAPASVDVNTGERMVRIDRHLTEYLLFQTLWVLFKSRFTHGQRQLHAAFDTQAVLDAWQHLPSYVLRPERNKRQHLSNVLSRNEVEREYAYNRALFHRVAQGWYQFNPKLSVRRTLDGVETWVPVYQALNLPFINQFSRQEVWPMVDRYLELAGLPARTIPIAAERALARQQAQLEARERERREQQEALEQLLAQRQAQQRKPPDRPSETHVPWGTPAARRQEIARVRRAIEERKRQDNGE